MPMRSNNIVGNDNKIYIFIEIYIFKRLLSNCVHNDKYLNSFKEKSHSHVYKHTMGIKCPGRYMARCIFNLGCYLLYLDSLSTGTESRLCKNGYRITVLLDNESVVCVLVYHTSVRLYSPFYHSK